MRYHTRLSTLLISVIVVLIFAFVSISVIVALSQTSPTLLIANFIFSSLKTRNSDLSISFSSIERNLRDRIYVNDFQIAYKGEMLLSLEKITINRGLFSLLAYFFNHRGIIRIEANSGFINIPSSFFQTEEKVSLESPQDAIGSIFDRVFSINPPRFLSSWGLALDVSDLDLIIGGGLQIDDITLNGYWNHGPEGMILTAEIPIIEYRNNSGVLDADNIIVSIREEEGLTLSLSLSRAGLSSEDLNAELTTFLAQTVIDDISSITLSELPLNVVYDSFEGNIRDIFIKTGPMILHEESMVGSLVVDKIDFVSDEIEGEIDSLSVSTDGFDEFDYKLDGIYFENGAVSLIDSDLIYGSYIIGDGNFELDIPRLESDIIRELTQELYGKAIITDFNFAFSHKEDLSFSSKGNIDALSLDPLLSDLKISEDISFEFKDNAIESAKIKIFSREDDPNGIDIELSASRDGIGGEFKVDRLSLEGLFSERIFIDFDLSEFRLNPYRPIINIFAPWLSSYISENTYINGSVMIDLNRNEDSIIHYTGPFDINLSIEQIRFNDFSFDLSLSSSGFFEKDIIEVSSLNIETSPVGIAFNGSVEYRSLLPSGHFSVYSPRTQSEYLIADLNLQSDGIYGFTATAPHFTDTFIRGIVDFTNDGIVSSVSTLSLFSNLYPFSLIVDLERKNISVNHENFQLIADYMETLSINAIFDSLSLINETAEVTPSSIEGEVNFDFDFKNQRYQLDVPELRMNKLTHIPYSPTLILSLSGDNNEINLSNIALYYDGLPSLRGSSLISFADNSFSLYLHSEDFSEEYLASIIKEGDSYTSVLKFSNMLLDRVGLEDMRGDLLLSGSANRLEEFDFSGDFTAESLDPTDNRVITAELALNESLFEMRNIRYTHNKTSFSSPYLGFSSKSGEFRLDDLFIALAFEGNDRDHPISLLFSLSGRTDKKNTLFQGISNLITTKGESVAIQGVLENLNIDDVLITPKRSFTAQMKNGTLTFFGDLLYGTFTPERSFVDLSVNLSPVAEFSLSGSYQKENFALFLDIDSVNLLFVDFSMKSPLVQFDPNFSIKGNVTITRENDAFSLYGQLGAETAEFEVFYLPNQKIILHNPTFLAWGTDITSVLCDATVLNLNTYERTPGKISLGLYFNDNLSFSSWDLEVYIDDGNEIDFRLPAVTSNIDIIGKVSGFYRIEGNIEYIKNTGIVTVDNTTLSIGMRELPEWWKGGIPAEIDFEILLRENAEFVFPLGPNPILVANIQDNTRVHYNYVPGRGMNLTGDINLRSGEIYYFQKYFYITEGSLVFRSSSEGFNPVLNLRARLRDFDSNGDPVDIYLVLRDATLDNISPTFESTPSLEQNEILSILGQAILPTSAYGEDAVRTVVSAATASIDILSRFGIINPMDTGLSSTIRNSLFLDTFSLHSNILMNILTDTVSLMGIEFYSPYTPLARYLDGTTLFMGKYLTQNLYFQAMLHLSAERTWNQNRFSFIASDLVLDTELSIEWNNPMFTAIFFTQPVNLTAFSLIDGFGFTLMKRMVF